jgi:hypothetical protein
MTSIQAPTPGEPRCDTCGPVPTGCRPRQTERQLEQGCVRARNVSKGSSGGLRLAGWTSTKRSASVGRLSSDARSIRSSVSSARAWSATLNCAPSSPSIAGAATRFKRGWSSLGAWWCGATVERLLGGSRNRRHWPHHQSVSAKKPVDSTPVSDARFAVRVPCLPLPVAPQRRPCFRGNQTAV